MFRTWYVHGTTVIVIAVTVPVAAICSCRVRDVISSSIIAVAMAAVVKKQ